MKPAGNNNSLHRWGIIISAIYIGLWATYALNDKQSFAVLKPNEIGDWLAGVFSPLAFAWVIIGFFQQHREIEQTRQALIIQGNELKNSVDQQKNLVNISHRQYESDIEHKRLEIKKLSPRISLHLGGSIQSSPNHDQEIIIKNMGNTAYNLCIYIDNLSNVARQYDRVNTSKNETFKINFTNILQNQEIYVQYEDQIGNSYEQKYALSGGYGLEFSLSRIET